MKLLVIEDDKTLLEYLKRGLVQEGFVVETATNGRDGYFRASCEPHDALVVDVMLPEMDGFTIVEKLRNEENTTPALFLSALSSVDDRVKGLRAGGDDYMVKPFAFTELVARLQALIRRSTKQSSPTTIEVADLTMDLIRRKAFRGDVELDLQPLEYTLLSFLMRHTGRVVSKTMIMERVWEYNFDPQTNVVEARICRLRDKVDRPFETKLIHTVRGFGYVLERRGGPRRKT